MRYTELGRTGLRVSRLGFGCMRLPMTSAGQVDRELAIPMLRKAVELGINFFDTAVGYCGGDSQRALGEAMEGIRDRVILSTKNHHYDKSDKARWWKNLEDSLERLRVEHIDVYGFHGMNADSFGEAVGGEDGLYQEMLKAKEQGLIRHIGHSFHGSAESLMKCVDTGLFESVILQYNLLDQHLEEGIAYAAARGMGVVVMGPVGGGRLGHPSEKVKELVGDVKSTPELALRFVLSNPNVTLALSGMSTMEQLLENVATVSGVGDLTQDDQDRIKAAVQERKELAGLYCTGCNYCMPCPAGVDIPANFEILNLERVFGLTDHARSRYASLAGKAALCRLCGRCVEPCPQDLDIPARLSEVVDVLDERAGRVGGWLDLLGAEADEEGMVHVRCRYHLKNFSPGERTVSIEFRSHGEDQVWPERVEGARMKPYARAQEDLELTLGPAAQGVSLDVALTEGEAGTLEHYHYVVAAARRAADYSLAPERRRGGALHVPSPLHPLVVSDEMPAGHSFDFRAAYDGENLYVWADVEDDLVRATEGDTEDYRDNLRIFLDGRKPGDLGGGRYGQGVIYFSVYPYAEAGRDPQVTVRGADGGVTARAGLTASGYRVDCAVPWSLFSQTDGLPGVIGLDLAMTSYDADGGEVVRLTWTGRSRQERRPSSFGRLLLA